MEKIQRAREREPESQREPERVKESQRETDRSLEREIEKKNKILLFYLGLDYY